MLRSRLVFLLAAFFVFGAIVLFSGYLTPTASFPANPQNKLNVQSQLSDPQPATADTSETPTFQASQKANIIQTIEPPHTPQQKSSEEERQERYEERKRQRIAFKERIQRENFVDQKISDLIISRGGRLEQQKKANTISEEDYKAEVEKLIKEATEINNSIDRL